MLIYIIYSVVTVILVFVLVLMTKAIFRGVEAKKKINDNKNKNIQQIHLIILQYFKKNNLINFKQILFSFL